ncbi:MAG TPA: hypothetical protein VEM57_11000 [Candidatus Binatus sp.]|nr:hypothetical protein [Candidatus Binatus sp.]
MVKRVLLPVLLLAAVVGAVVYVGNLRSELSALRRADDTKAPAPPTAAQGQSSLPRTLTPEQRQAMLDVLRSENGAIRKVWFQVELNRSEPVAFQKALEQVFKEAGWEVQTSGAAGMTFKPGLYLLVGEEDWPSYASTAFEALQKAGIDVKAASGYRSYYDQQKAEKPGWAGPKLSSDQAYVVLIGANPTS